MGLYWDEFEIGQKFKTVGRTITEADIVAFAGVSGDYNVLHMDEEYCKTTMFGSRIAHGLLGLSIYTGLFHATGITEGTVMAFLGVNWSFKKPIKIGDTISCEQEVVFKRETKKIDRGIVTFKARVINQRGEVVQEGERTVMVAKKPALKQVYS